MAAVVTGTQCRITALPNAVRVVSATGCTGIAEEVAVFTSWTLKVLGALAGTIRQANRRIVVIGTAEAWRTVPIVAGFWVNAVRLFTNQSVRCAIKLVVTRR